MEITQSTFKDAAITNAKVPEFEKSRSEKEYKERIENKKHLILIAKKNNFKIVETIKKYSVEDHKILLEKELK